MNAFDLPALDRALAATPFAGKLHHFASIDSTNSHAMQAGAQGAPSGSVYFADEQTAGKGRGGHTWHSAAGNGLYVSLLLRPAIAPADVLWFSLAAGLAVHTAVRNTTGLAADLRWPNDLMLGKRKFCGILTELHAEVTRIRHVVVGIGINVGHESFPPELAELATSLRIAGGRLWSRQQLLVALLESLKDELSPLMDPATLPEASRSIPARLEAISTWIRGKHVIVGDPAELEGTTAGLDERGFLLVKTADGLRTVLSGGVREAT